MPVSIMIYVHRDDDLSRYLDRLQAMGFVVTDWCELTCGADRVTYGPCEPQGWVGERWEPDDGTVR